MSVAALVLLALPVALGGQVSMAETAAAPTTTTTTRPPLVRVTRVGTTTAVYGPQDPEAGVTGCATTSTGRRLACLSVHADGDGWPDGTLCTYDDVLGIFGWGLKDEVVCVETTDDWGYISGPGLCERSLGMDRPDVCLNGRDQCLLWVMGVRIVCHGNR